jgi:hypothetical protein
MSDKPSHPALVSEADFVTVQKIHTAPTAADGSLRCYALTGLIYCDICGRAMDAHWTHAGPATAAATATAAPTQPGATSRRCSTAAKTTSSN